MSLISDYEQRTVWKYEPIRGSFHTHEGLTRKVDAHGNYLPFLGSTVVFRPGKQTLQVIQLMQRVLYYKLNGIDMLSPILPASTIHMTLHDLVSPEMRRSDTDDGYAREVSESVDRAASIVDEIRKEYAGSVIRMVADRIVNMVSKSLVLLLRPETEREFEMLCELYRRFDAIQTLPYSLTPHITLAYFKPGPLDGDALGAAVDFAQINPEHAPVFEFSPEGLTAQRFLDMKTYMDIPGRICFCCDGGLNRSVMAANIVTHLARERGLPVLGQARAAFPDTQGCPVREQVWETLKANGIQPDRSYTSARYLEEDEVSSFTCFAEISDGAEERMARLGLPDEKVYNVSRFFYGVRDPEYGFISYEQAFKELYDRAEKYLDFFEAGYRKNGGGKGNE